jgi:hypothetical protein
VGFILRRFTVALGLVPSRACFVRQREQQKNNRKDRKAIAKYAKTRRLGPSDIFYVPAETSAY